MTSNNLPAIKQTNSLQKIESKLAITNKLLAEINDEWLVDFFVRNNYYFIQFVAKYYNLPERYLNNEFFYNSGYFWESLSKNRLITWSLELIDKYSDKLYFSELSSNPSIPWSIELIEKYRYEWIWGNHYSYEKGGLIFNPAIPWSIELISKFNDEWEWDWLSQDVSIPWSIELISKFMDKLNWYKLSANVALPWSLELIEKFEDKWQWNELSRNTAIPYSVELIEKFRYDWNWKFLYENSSLPWSIEFIVKFDYELFYIFSDGLQFDVEKVILFREYLSDWYLNRFPISSKVKLIDKELDNWYWKKMSAKSLAWSIELIEKYEENWDWNYLSGNNALPWSIELIEKYKDKWAWKGLSINTALPWTIELIEKYEDKWDWNYLSGNKALPWSIELIEKYEDKWDCGGLFFQNTFALPLYTELIDKYKNKIEDEYSWVLLSENEALPWTLEFIEKHKDKWVWEALSINTALPWSKKLILQFEYQWKNFIVNNDRYGITKHVNKEMYSYSILSVIGWIHQDQFNNISYLDGAKDFLLSKCTEQLIEKVIKKQNKSL